MYTYVDRRGRGRPEDPLADVSDNANNDNE